MTRRTSHRSPISTAVVAMEAGELPTLMDPMRAGIGWMNSRMKCFICGSEAAVHIIRGLKSASGTNGTGRICIPCAWEYDLDGEFHSPLDGSEDSEANQQDKTKDA